MIDNNVAEHAMLSDHDYRLVSQFLFREAQLLDANLFDEWLATVTQDFHYLLTGPTTTMWKTGSTVAPPSVVLLDENMGSLKTRVRQLTTAPFTVSENPRSFVNRFVTNIMIESVGDESLIKVRSNVLIYRSREAQLHPNLFALVREDILRRQGEQLLLAKRHAQLSEAIINAGHIATLF